MKKAIIGIMAFALTLTLLLPVMSIPAMASADVISGYVTEIDRNTYDQLTGTLVTENGKTYFAFGYFVADSKDGWFLRVTDANTKGILTVVYKTSSGYFTVTFDINGKGDYWVGEGSGKNAVIQAKIGRLLTPPNSRR